MSRRAERSILRAAERTVISEDRLTEMMATALVAHRGLAAKLYEHAYQAAAPDTLAAEASTQHQAGRDARVDLVVDFITDAGQRTLWLENKIWAVFQHQQLERYADAAGDRIDVACLLPSGREREVPAGTRTLTWHDVAEWVDTCGREHAPDATDWRVNAFTPGTPVEVAVLADFLDEIERRTGVIMQGLSSDDARALGGVNDLLTRGQALMDGAIDAAGLERDPQGESLIKLKGSHAWQHVAWSGDSSGWGRLDAACQPEVYWAGDGFYSGYTGQATISAGITIPIASGLVLLDQGQEIQTWRSKISQDGFDVSHDKHWVRVFAHWPLEDLVAERPTLSEQINTLGTWLQQRLQMIEATPPPVPTSPPGA